MVSTTPSLPKIAEAAWFLDAALTTYIKIRVNCRSVYLLQVGSSLSINALSSPSCYAHPHKKQFTAKTRAHATMAHVRLQLQLLFFP